MTIRRSSNLFPFAAWTTLLVLVGLLGWCPHASAATTETTGAATEQPMLSPEEALSAFHLPEGFEIRLVASEPDLVNPMTMALDEEGRIYVSLSHTYRYGKEGAPVPSPSNPVMRLTLDSNGQVASRSLVASGFADPVMGLAIRGNRLWATNLNRVLVTDLGPRGEAISLRPIVVDAETPWNPFGMYRIDFGPDGLLYLSVGDHPISLKGATNQVAVRGNTGGVFRFQPDGSNIELLAQGMRAPFSFDFGSFGRMWLLSNGEGNPNRLIHVIGGADYHFQTRKVDWAWLAGQHALAPPVWENPAGAHTAVLVYRSDAFPEPYWGNLFVSNWGVHGFPSANHVILRHLLDEAGNLVHTEPFLTTTDPHFRPTQITHAPDGNLYVLDWYGKDDENDLTGRLYKIVFTGNHAVGNGPDHGKELLHQDQHATGGLASRNHAIRRRAQREMLATGPSAMGVLKRFATGSDSLGAAEALWTLRQSGWEGAPSMIELALEHSDWRVRRLAMKLLREMDVHPNRLRQLLNDPEPAVQMEAALSLPDVSERMAALSTALRHGAANNPRLRYQAALEVARHGTERDLEGLLNDRDRQVRLAGLIALDETFQEGAFQEGIETGPARQILSRYISEPQDVSLLALLSIGEQWPHSSLTAPVIALLNRDIPPAEFSRGLAILRRLQVPLTREKLGGAVERLLGNLLTGEVVVESREEKIAVLRIVALEPSGANALSMTRRLIRDADVEVRIAAHRALSNGAARDSRYVDLCWELASDESVPTECRLDAVASLVKIDNHCSKRWLKLLHSRSDRVTMASLRCLQHYAGQSNAKPLLEAVRDTLLARGESFQREFRFVERAVSIKKELDVPLPEQTAAQSAGEDSKQALRKWLLANLTHGDPLLGRLAFRRMACSRCHLAGESDLPLGPGLEGVSATNGPEYLIDSVLYPSQVIKTGYRIELIVTDAGKTYSGNAIQKEDHLVVTTETGDQYRIPLDQVEERKTIDQSLMPEALERGMSEAELLDLTAYLLTLRTPPGKGR